MRKSGMRVSMYGQLTLTAKNLLPDPGIRSFEPDGSPTYWTLAAPPSKTSRNVYIGETGERPTAQNATPIPAARNAYRQHLALVTGHGLPGAKPRSSYLQQARPPFVYGRAAAARGYPGGAYPVSYAWVVGSLYNPRFRALTNPAPPRTVSLAQGQPYELPLPDERAENALGIAILQGLPDGPNNVLYVQEIIDIRSFMPPSRVMDGPLRTNWRAPQTNTTYCGAFWTRPGPTMRVMSGVRTLEAMRVRTSYKFRTDLGVSASQGYTDRVIGRALSKRSLRFFFPPLPPRAIAIIPQVQGPDSAWYDIDYGFRGGDVPIIPGWNWSPYILTDDPNAEYKGLMTYEGSERSMVDETGIPGPDTILEEARSFGLARLRAARYTIRTSDVYDFPGQPSEESPPSAPQYITVGENQFLEVDFREEAEEGSVIPNADFEDRKPNGDPRRYSFPAAVSANLSVSAQQSVVYFDDSTSRTSAEEVFRTDSFSVVNSPHTFRGGVRFDRATSGTAQLAVYFYDAAGNQLAGQQIFNSATDTTSETSFGPVGSGVDVEWSGKAETCVWVALLRGNVAARNLKGRFVHIGLFRGRAAPTKAAEQPNPVPALEPETGGYPEGSYIRVVENPSWAKNKGNGIEYYGSALAWIRYRHFAYDFRIPVTPNRLYALQCEYSYKGVAAGTQILPVVIRDENDRVTQNLGLVAERASETDPDAGGGVFTRVIETGPRDSYIEVIRSALGPGLVRAWGFQLEHGQFATAWSDQHSPSGTAAATFQTITPGLEDRPHLARRLFGIRSIAEFGASADTPEGTEVSVRARSRATEADEWSEYVTDAADLQHTGIVEVEVSASTTDLSVSPEISDIYARAVPPRPVLLRSDGSEFDGGILVEGLPGTSYPENTEDEPRMDQSRRIKELYPPERELAGLTFKAHSDRGAEAAMYDAAHGEREFIIEGYGVIRLVRITNIRFAPDRTQKIGNGLYVHTASDVSAQILEEAWLEPQLDGAPV